MKRNDFLKTMAALFVVPKVIASSNKVKVIPEEPKSYGSLKFEDGRFVEMTYNEITPEFPLTPKESLELLKMTGNIIYRRV